MSLVTNLATELISRSANLKTTIEGHMDSQKAATQVGFDAKQVAEDADFSAWLAARDAAHGVRNGEIAAQEAAGLQSISDLIGDSAGSGMATTTIFGAYRLFIDNDSNADAALTAAYNAEDGEIAAYRTALGIDDEDTILALV